MRYNVRIMKSLCMLGRQPAISLVELESLYGADAITVLNDEVALVHAHPDISRLGGTQKIAQLYSVTPEKGWQAIEDYLAHTLPTQLQDMPDRKIHLGFSVYGMDIAPKQLQRTGLTIKKALKQAGRSVRVVPNKQAALSSAQVYHNHFTDENGAEIIIAKGRDRQLYIGKTIAVQDIDAYRQRDQERPKRDAKVGMLPPKLAQIIVNLAVGPQAGKRLVAGSWRLVTGDELERVSVSDVTPEESGQGLDEVQGSSDERNHENSQGLDVMQGKSEAQNGDGLSEVQGSSDERVSRINHTVNERVSVSDVTPEESGQGLDVTQGSSENSKEAVQYRTATAGRSDNAAIHQESLAQLAMPADKTTPLTVLDPFCGTGVILQETLLMHYPAYGTDIEPRMIDYSRQNLDWLNYDKSLPVQLEVADATTHQWDSDKTPFDVIAAESYLGRPFSSAPKPNVLEKVMQDVDTIHRKFLKNVAQQTKPGFRLCLAVPAWHVRGRVYHLKTLDSLEKLGYTRQSFVHAEDSDLVYRRPDQIVGRELTVLVRN